MYTFVFAHSSFCTLLVFVHFLFLYTFCFCTLVAGRQLPSGSNFGSWSPLQMWQGPLSVLHYTVFFPCISRHKTLPYFPVFHDTKLCRISLYFNIFDLVVLYFIALTVFHTHTPLVTYPSNISQNFVLQS